MRPDVLIIARSGRQLAGAARRAGYAPIVIDLFGDADTQSLCAANFVIRPSHALAFPASRLLDLVGAITASHGALPIVCGSGFEDQIHLLAALEVRGQHRGCTAASVAACKDPVRLGRGLADLGIASAPAAWIRPPSPRRCLLKRRGGCGGDHVRPAAAQSIPGQREYFSAHIEGTPLSAAFIARPGDIRVLGMCAALPGLHEEPAAFRYAGAIAVPDIFARHADEVRRIAAAVSESFSLRGLCGIDFIAGSDGSLTVLEINPRPTATFDLLADPGDVFAAHMGTAAGPARIHTYADVRASGVCTAMRSFTVRGGLDLPAWCADRPAEGTRIVAGMPVCSAYVARAGDVATTRRKLTERLASLGRLFAGESTANESATVAACRHRTG